MAVIAALSVSNHLIDLCRHRISENGLITALSGYLELFFFSLALSQSCFVGREFVFELVLRTFVRTSLDLLTQRTNFFIGSQLDVGEAVIGTTFLFVAAL